jgi:methyl-accepting chemotaxis protein
LVQGGREVTAENDDSLRKRINAILEVLQKVAEGEMNVSVPISEKTDDLDALAAGVNMMIEEVRERTRELEQKNNELESFNRMAVGRELKMVELKKRIAELEEKSKSGECKGKK